MRISGRLAIAVAGLLTGAAIVAPAAQAAQTQAAQTQAAQTQAAQTQAAQTHAAQAPARHGSATRAPGGVAAPWALLANATTGKWLWSRSPTVERPMGSITKIMTAYLVIEAGHLNRVITVPSGIIGYDTTYDASTAGLVPGEKLTALQLLYALLLPSGCDAAYTLATAYGPGRAAFIRAMNTTARKLGLTRTHFNDFSGLPVGGEYATYSTARDLVVLGRDAMKLSLFGQIVAQRTYSLASGNGHRAHYWVNKNTLLWNYRGAIGIKTGQAAAAGACLLFEARRGAKTLIGVVLHSSSFSLNAAFSDATKMLNWGFSQ